MLKDKYKERRIFLLKLAEAKIHYITLNYRPTRFKVVNFDTLSLGQKIIYREYLLCETEAKVVENLETLVKFSYYSRVYKQEKVYWLLFDSDLLMPLNN